MTTKLELLEALKMTREKRVFVEVGICTNVSNYLWEISAGMEGFEMMLAQLFKGWPRHTGNNAFPVPHSRKMPAAAYNTLPLWSKRTQYGRARFELLDYAITKLEAEIANEVQS